jgi:tRNA(Ile)-lysidine synthase
VHDLPERVLRYIRRHNLLQAGDRIGVAVSGGADSVALLRAFLELRSQMGIVLSVVHFNHKLREPDSDADALFVAELARRHRLEFYVDSADVRRHAAQQHLSIEAAARSVRYDSFKRLLSKGELTRVATAHTLDDQAETVLLRMIRGAGTRGLAGIYRTVQVGTNSIVRPLLETNRKDVLRYLSEIKQDWREDRSNRDLRFARNRIRHGILPRLELHVNPSVRETLSESAEIARAEEDYWAGLLASILPALWTSSELDGHLKLPELVKQPLALQRRILRAACETMGMRLDFKHVEELRSLADPRGPKSVVLPSGWSASRQRDCLRISIASKEEKADYEYPVSIPGEINVAQTGTSFRVRVVQVTSNQGYNPDRLLDRESIGPQLTIRNWHAGDRFLPPHTKSLKKVKELLQERHITGEERKLWPVATNGADIVWIRGFPSPAKLRPREDAREAVLIEEV